MAATPLRIIIKNEARHAIDPRLFGHFLERPSWGETGPESAVDECGQLPEAIRSKLKAMDIPVVRFPGGTDVDYMDWTELIDNYPTESSVRTTSTGHKGDRVTNRFGLDEYLSLAEEFDWDSIIVVNFLDALAKRVPLEKASRHAAGLVAYCNAEVGAQLPEGMPDWPSIRQKNGRARPYHVPIFQLGNEWWMDAFRKNVAEGTGYEEPEALQEWYTACIIAFADAMRAVDPSIELIIDGKIGNGMEQRVLADPAVREAVNYVAFHIYSPGPMEKFYLDGQPVIPGELSMHEAFLVLSSVLGKYGTNGQSIGFGSEFDLAHRLGYGIAVTEWNWNGWSVKKAPFPDSFHWRHAAAAGTAVFLNGMLRQADRIKIATQSLLIGHEWDIATIRYGASGENLVHLNAQGSTTLFYDRHRGDQVLEVVCENNPLLEQSLGVGWRREGQQVATVDAVATLGKSSVFCHMVNRSAEILPVSIHLDGFITSKEHAQLHLLEKTEPETLSRIGGWVNQRTCLIKPENGHVDVELPPMSISILQIPLSE